MAIAFIFELPGITQEQYEIVHQELGNPIEQGVLVHIAGPMQGGWRVVEVWPSQEAADRFFSSERARQAFQKANSPAVQPTIMPVHASYASAQPT